MPDQSALLSRRALFLCAAGAAGATAILCAEPEQAGAVIKISKTAVAYQDQPNGDKACDKCAQFQPPAACKLVDGAISPRGYCQLFVPVRQTAN
jgi:hypothetical protein